MTDASFKTGQYDDNLQEQRDEIFALQSIYNTEDDERLKLISEVTEEKDKIFTFMMTVNPRPFEEMLQVIIVLPVNDSYGPDEVEGACAAPPTTQTPQLAKTIQLNRSVSGQRWQGSFEVKFLPPMQLLATFPPTYPSTSPPEFHLSCDWLSYDQLACLERMLENLWSEACNMPVVFTWIDWLENSCLSHLAIIDQLILKPNSDVQPEIEQGTSGEDSDSVEELGSTIATMIRFNQEKMDEEFCQTMHLCEVCYEELPGTQFFRLKECPHAFCHGCMQAFCDLHVTDGTVEELRCPTPKCESIIPPHIIQAVLPEEAYQRWEQLLLQKTLDSMEDTVYCPRCTSVVITDKDNELHFAQCPMCYFAFCTSCGRGWHQGRNCETEEEQLENLQTKNFDGMSRAVRRKMEYLRWKLEEESSSKKTMYKSTRPCPKCKIPVEKIGGCNKMTCKCSQMFCWLCGKAISGYSHFQGGVCELFPGQNPVANRYVPRRVPEAMLRIQAMLAINPDLLNMRCYCPMCKQESLKGHDRNNHIKCWNCKTNFCFVCRQRIVGSVTAHFTGPCDQHS